VYILGFRCSPVLRGYRRFETRALLSRVEKIGSILCPETSESDKLCRVTWPQRKTVVCRIFQLRDLLARDFVLYFRICCVRMLPALSAGDSAAVAVLKSVIL
jgi:hypothetical protein